MNLFKSRRFLETIRANFLHCSCSFEKVRIGRYPKYSFQTWNGWTNKDLLRKETMILWLPSSEVIKKWINMSLPRATYQDRIEKFINARKRYSDSFKKEQSPLEFKLYSSEGKKTFFRMLSIFGIFQCICLTVFAEFSLHYLFLFGGWQIHVLSHVSFKNYSYFHNFYWMESLRNFFFFFFHSELAPLSARVAVASFFVLVGGLFLLLIRIYQGSYVIELHLLEDGKTIRITVFNYFATGLQEIIVPISDIVPNTLETLGKRSSNWFFFRVVNRRWYYLIDKAGTFQHQEALRNILLGKHVSIK